MWQCRPASKKQFLENKTAGTGQGSEGEGDDGVLKGFNLVICVKGRTSTKGGRAGKETVMCLLVSRSRETFPMDFWIEGVGEGPFCRRKF